jgi:hypothetical protein
MIRARELVRGNNAACQKITKAWRVFVIRVVLVVERAETPTV